MIEIIKADASHAKWILRHRLEMFRSMGWSDEELDRSEPIIVDFLTNDWDDNIACYIVVDEGEVKGGCAVSYHRVLPTYKNPSGVKAYIHNLYVEPEYRKQGIATLILNHILELCRKKGIRRASLHSTDMGLGVYLKAGFVKSEKYYKINLENQ